MEILIFLILMASMFFCVQFIRSYNCRRFACIKRLLLAIGYDKFESVTLNVTPHSVSVLLDVNTGAGGKSVSTQATAVIKITAGGREYWTKPSDADGNFKESFDCHIPQGYRKVIVELYLVDAGVYWFDSKRLCAQRVIDVQETVIARRAFGSIRKELFSLVPKSDGSKL